MKNTFTLEVGQSALIGIPRESLVTVALGDGKRYSAPIEKVHKALARWHAKEHPSGKKRRKLFTSSEEMRRLRKEHPD